MALAQSVVNIIRPTAGTWRVVLSRWALYIVAMLPGLLAMRRHLEQTVGLRPWFQDVEMPLDMLSFKFVAAELLGGMSLLMLGAFFVWVLQLVWLAGALQLLDTSKNYLPGKIFANGWSYLGRFVRVAVFSILAIIALHLALKFVFGSLAARAELDDWTVQKSFFDLNLWRAVLTFTALTLVGTFAFWARVITVADSRRKLRRLPLLLLRLFVRRPVSALIFQFAAIAVVLCVQAVALWSWRQSGGGIAWLVLWAMLLLVASWIWQLRIRAALIIWQREDLRLVRD
ncbi:MAG: hypothetical protein OEM64_12830 [Gammaproteobacteria bacterium]|nr:hypothetical protein [Gammaproteobacteria bacterium]MDH3417186.1 hypothetical protein [Gammaproteobacteria bacterium]